MSPAIGTSPIAKSAAMLSCMRVRVEEGRPPSIFSQLRRTFKARITSAISPTLGREKCQVSNVYALTGFKKKYGTHPGARPMTADHPMRTPQQLHSPSSRVLAILRTFLYTFWSFGERVEGAAFLRFLVVGRPYQVLPWYSSK